MNRFRIFIVCTLLTPVVGISPRGFAAGTTADGVTVTNTPDVDFWSFEDQGLNVGKYDPVLFVEPDGPYHYMYVGDGNEDGVGSPAQDLYRSTDLRSWEKIADNVRDNNGDLISNQGGTNFNWGRKVNGTYYLYQSRQDTAMHLYTGTDLATLTYQGQVLDESDGGGFYDDTTGTWHMYYEAGNISGPSGDALGHATSTDGINWTKQANLALDLGPGGENTGWKTGDPDIIKVNDTYHMFIDNTVQHPNYRIAWATSTDLYNWELKEDTITHFPGGDAVVRYLPDTDEFIMYQEYRGTTGPNENEAGRKGIGYAIAPANGFKTEAALDPATLSGLKLWLKDAETDFDPGTAGFDAVWTDRSGNGNDMAAYAGTTGDGQPGSAGNWSAASDDPTRLDITNAVTGNTFSAVRFSGSANELMKSDLLGADGDDAGGEGSFNNLTIFTVYRIDHAVYDDVFRPLGVGSERDVSSASADHFNLAGDASIRKDNGAIDNADEQLPVGEFFIRISRMTNAGNNYDDVDEWLLVDGGQLDLLQARGVSFTTSDDDFFLGDLRVDGSYLTGDDFAIAEVLVFDVALSDAQVGGVASYLDERYFGFPFVAGDADGDGDVDGDDLAALAGSWRQSDAGWLGGDFNTDGVTDILDLNALASSWGHGLPTTPSFETALAGVTFVPEPTMGMLLSVGIGAMLLGRTTRRGYQLTG